MLALMLFATLSAAPDLLAEEALMRFSRKPARGRVSVEVSAGRIDGRPDEPARYWLRRTVDDRTRAVTTWTDTQRCPAALTVLRKGAALEPPRPDLPGLVDAPADAIRHYRVVADGALYALSVDAAYDNQIGSTLSFTSNVGTPLADWIDESLPALEGCWSSTSLDGLEQD